MLRYSYRLISFLIACALIVMGPAAGAGTSTATRGHDSAAEDDCRGRGHSKDHPHKDRDGCEEEDDQDQAPPPSEESEEEGEAGDEARRGNGKGRGHENGRGHSESPGRAEKEDTPADEGDDPPPGTPGSKPPGDPRDKTPPGQEGPADVTVDVDVNRTLAQVGTVLTYEISVTNVGPSATTLTIHNDIPAEVDFLSSTETVTMTGADSLAWSLPALEAGSVATIRWTGRVARLGDLDAVNVVSVEGAGADTTPVETHTYLASVQGVRVQRSAAEPDWGTHTERRVVFRSVGAHAPSTAGTSSGSAAPLPQTGVPALELVLIAALFVLGGLVLTGRGRRIAAAMMMVVLVAAACTSEAPRPEVAQSTESAEEDDEVLGTRVKKPNKGSGSDATPGVPGTDNGSTDNGSTAPESSADDVTEPQAPAADEPPDEDEVVKEIVLVQVANEPPEPQPVGPTNGSNSISLTWDEPSRSITTATSGRMISADSQIDVLSSVSDAGNGMSTTVTLENVTRDERLHVRGHLIVSISGSGGSIELSSPPIDQILEPGDEVSADFVLALPSGSYVIESFFSAA